MSDSERKLKKKLEKATLKNTILEKLVEDSTRELFHANERLEKSLEEVYQSRRSLIQSEKLASIGQLAAGVGHEINNPLTIVKGNVTRIKKQMSEPSPDKNIINKATEQLDDSIERIRVIVDGLRTYARTDTEEMDNIEIHDAIEKTVSLINSIFEKDNIKLKLQLNAIKHTVLGNVGKLQQVFMNFLTNARDATEGRKDRNILIRTENDKDEIIVSVIDNGCGMSDDVKNKIFDTFFTTKPVGQGTGLGLGITASLIKEMRGTIEVDTEVGKGSAFRFRFALVGKSDIAQPQPAEHPVPRQRKVSGLALVVDDEGAIRDLLRECLEELGMKVDEADDGDTALRRVKLSKYDYIFTDLKMERMSGDQFIEEAKKLPNGTTKYFIITAGTTTASKEMLSKLWKLADGYLLKPFDDESIYQLLREQLNEVDEAT